MDRTAIHVVRRFNRTVGEELGLLGRRFLGVRRPPGESRLLWEIGPEGADLRSLRQRLALDSGYLTRVIHSLERQRLVRVRAGRADRRVRHATLTARGRTERALLDRRSDALAERILKPLSARQRALLTAAMTDVDRLLRASMVVFAIESPWSDDARWCLNEYFKELDERFDRGFDPGRGLPAEPQDLTPPAGLFVIARLGGRPVGCGALNFHGKAPAEVLRMWIAPGVRGLGLGARLLRELETRARLAGARIVRLETNRALTEAVALYRRSGYVEVARFSDEPYAHHWFEKRLVGIPVE
jgi:DNA-binding MarR family transcriptional regulator/GNAT superfamily N-acetyltransferase